MKITYSQPTPINLPTLANLCAGSVFRPAGSRRIFMLTDTNGESPFLTDQCSVLNNFIENFSHDFDCSREDYDSLALCVELENSTLCLISYKTMVEEIEYEFKVEEK